MSSQGCGTAFDGLVNYCLCRGEMCNKESLLSQAQSNLPEHERAPSTTSTTSTVKPPPVVELFGNVDMGMDVVDQPIIVPSSNTHSDVVRVNAQVPDLNANMIEPVGDESSEEDRMKMEKRLREQKWKEDSERLLRETANSSLLRSPAVVVALTLLTALWR